MRDEISATIRMRRLPSRLLSIYLGLYLLPFPLDCLPWIGPRAERLWHALWLGIVPWLSARFLGVPVVDPFIANGGGGSGDTAFEYVRLLCLAAIALITALAWTLFERAPRERPAARQRFHVAIRYYLAISMLSYGGIKVFRSQFPFPDPVHWWQAYRAMTPMRLLWDFMGYSAAYTFFCGATEGAGALLLLSRRTSTLGALIVLAVMSNVVMLNFCYDVPVKLYSTHLLLLALVLLAPEARRLAEILVLNRSVGSRPLPPHFAQPSWNRAGRLAKGSFIAWSLFEIGRISIGSWMTHGDRAPRPELYGAYEVEVYRREGKTLPPLLGDTERWRRFFVSRASMAIQRMDDGIETFRGTLSPATQAIVLTRGSDAMSLRYEKPAADRLTLDGNDIAGFRIHVELKRENPNELPLLRRGFHWINEEPAND